MRAWTDYPIAELGDKPGVSAPIREVEIVSYDGNKYVTVAVGGVETSFKAGYLYKVAGRLGRGTSGDVPGFTHEELLAISASSHMLRAPTTEARGLQP